MTREQDFVFLMIRRPPRSTRKESSAASDVYKRQHLGDRLGKLKITDIGINRRDEIVIRNFFERKIPICGVLGGGYNKDFEKLIELHASLHKNCAKYLNDKK